ncbi:MAG: sulfocyanin-like copper-binding protein [Kiloniellaceae bacterium]
MLRTYIFALVLAAAALAPSADAAERSVPGWVKWNAAKKTAELWIKAAYNGNNGSWNFNGYYEGGATVVVPVGARVLIHFENPDGNYPHSIVVTRPYGKDEMPERAGRDEVAIPRAYTRNPTGGCQACKEDMRFKAKKAGRYYLLCGVVGHAQAGMWIGFEVSEEAAKPFVLVTEDALAASDQPPWR